ncbi:MAG: polymerase sigma factor, partial [Solirubrobacterales bacterium]|nr:polymerase sigma factor [Solirubrobacterales bacterium]
MPDPRLDIAALYARHRDELLAFFVRRTSDTEIALDLWGETFAQALTGRERYRGDTDEEAGAWLYGIARRQLARYYRRGSAERRAMKRLGIERPAISPETEAEIVRRAGLDDLRQAIAAGVAMLPEDTREAIKLRIVDELSYPDLAARLAITEQAARKRVSRGMQTLGRVLDTQALTEAL